MSIINDFIASNGALFTFMGIAGGLFMYWKNGGLSMNKNIIESFKVRVEQLQTDLTRLQTDLAKKGEELGKLQGIIQSKDQQIAMMQSILQNRNPEMESFMKNMMEAIKGGQEQSRQAAQYMKDSMDVFKKILDFMKKIDDVNAKVTRGTEILDKQEKRHKVRVSHGEVDPPVEGE